MNGILTLCTACTCFESTSCAAPYHVRTVGVDRCWRQRDTANISGFGAVRPEEHPQVKELATVAACEPLLPTGCTVTHNVAVSTLQ